MANNKYELKILLKQEDNEIVIALLDWIAVNGIEVVGDQLTAYFLDKPSVVEVEELLGNRVEIISLNRIEDKNWNEVWESNFLPVEIDDFCRIYADFHKDPKRTFSFNLRINPKMSFGTGHHETTTMMIRMMSKINFESKRVFDYGTGTGVLGILASKMGAIRVLANDVEANAVENSIENVSVNYVENMDIEEGTLESLMFEEFDVILANINRNVLLNSAEELRARLKKGGVLLLSGILKEDKTIIDDAYNSKGFTRTDETALGKWICLQFS